MSLDLSIIIPYYNTGEYIREAIESIEQYKGSISYEIIIVNDGSTDELSLKELDRLQQTNKYIIAHQQNQGSSAARNAGVKISRGDFLFFLDSDNMVIPAYIDSSLKILLSNPEIGVVYGRPKFIGNIDRVLNYPQEFDIAELLDRNYIDMCAFVRRTSFDEAGGFDISPDLVSCVDWDLWLRVYKQNWKFHYLNEDSFIYRVRPDSITDRQRHKYVDSKLYIIRKNVDLYAKEYHKLLVELAIGKQEKKHPFRTLVKRLLGK